jgi:anti-anti-sigma factor
VRVESESGDGFNILRVTGRVTVGSDGADLLAARCREALEEAEAFLLLDMTETSYLDSAGIGVLVACGKRAFASGGQLKLVVSSHGPVRDVLVLTRLDQVLQIYADENEALKSFAEAKARLGEDRPRE